MSRVLLYKRESASSRLSHHDERAWPGIAGRKVTLQHTTSPSSTIRALSNNIIINTILITAIELAARFQMNECITSKISTKTPIAITVIVSIITITFGTHGDLR
uniref:Uncharacterized protein n=1 Tax=Octopus bimaculoides TaxID=37653 RepID=A0A0L8GNG0_OCTBM